MPKLNLNRPWVLLQYHEDHHEPRRTAWATEREAKREAAQRCVDYDIFDLTELLKGTTPCK